MNFLLTGARGEWKWRQEVSYSLTRYSSPSGLIYELDEFSLLCYSQNIDSQTCEALLRRSHESHYICTKDSISKLLLKCLRRFAFWLLNSERSTNVKRGAISAINYIASHPKATLRFFFFFLLYFRTESMCASKEKIFLEKKEKNAGFILRHTQNKIFRKYNIAFPRAAIVGRERDFRVVVDVLKPDRFSFFFDCALSLARQRPRWT